MSREKAAAIEPLSTLLKQVLEFCGVMRKNLFGLKSNSNAKTVRRAAWGALWASLALCACHAPFPASELNIAIESYPGNLDPRYPQDAYCTKVQGLLFNGLFKWDEQFRLVPDLAENYRYLSPARLYVKLRPHVLFHNGKTLTVRDVLYTYQTLRDPKKKSPFYESFKRVTRMQALDDMSLEIELQEPFAPFLAALTAGIIPEGADEAEPSPFSQRPVGTGPFRFDSLRPEQWIRLTAFTSHFAGGPKLDSLLIRSIRDDTTRVLQLLKGEIDLVQNSIPLVMTSWLQTHGNLRLASGRGINYAYLAFNLRDPALKDLRVRKAIALAIDRDGLIRYRLKGFAQKAPSLLAPTNAYYEPGLPVYAHDRAEAKRLLDAAGFVDPDGAGPHPRLVLTIKTSHKRDRIAMMRALAEQLSQVGIELRVQSYEWGTFFRDIKTGNFQLYASTWVGVNEPDIFYSLFHSSQTPPQGANRGYYRRDDVDEWLQKARSETDPLRRKSYYAKVQRAVAEDLPYVSLWYEDNVVFSRPEVQGYVPRPDASWAGLAQVKKISVHD